MIEAGVYIALEGIQWSGKSSNQLELVRRMVKEGGSVFSTQEPDGTLLGREMRRKIMEARGNCGGRVDINGEMEMFFEARYDLLSAIKGMKTRGIDSVVSRCFLSTEVHQIRLGHANRKSYMELMARVVLKPDLVLVYDLPAEAALARRRVVTENAFRNVEVEEMERRRSAYLDLVEEKAFGLRYVVIDANRPLEEVVRSSLLAIGL